MHTMLLVSSADARCWDFRGGFPVTVFFLEQWAMIWNSLLHRLLDKFGVWPCAQGQGVFQLVLLPLTLCGFLPYSHSHALFNRLWGMLMCQPLASRSQWLWLKQLFYGVLLWWDRHPSVWPLVDLQILLQFAVFIVHKWTRRHFNGCSKAGYWFCKVVANNFPFWGSATACNAPGVMVLCWGAKVLPQKCIRQLFGKLAVTWPCILLVELDLPWSTYFISHLESRTNSACSHWSILASRVSQRSNVMYLACTVKPLETWITQVTLNFTSCLVFVNSVENFALEMDYINLKILLKLWNYNYNRKFWTYPPSL